MPKLLSIRLLIKDDSGQLHKLCRVADDNDSRGEAYMKIMFVDFDRGTMTLRRNVGFRESDGTVYASDNAEPPMIIDPESASYHYIAGIRNLKDRDGTRYLERRDFPRLPDAEKPVLVCRYILSSYAQCEPVATIRADDIVLEDIELPTVFGFYISYKKEDGSHDFIDRSDGDAHHFVSVTDERIALTVTAMSYDNSVIPFSGFHFNHDPYCWDDSVVQE